MDFGIPQLNRVKKKEEKYEHLGVITLEPAEPGKSRRIVFNTKGAELLNINDKGIDNQIAFSFTGDKIYVANMNGLEGHSEVKVTKQNNVSNKKYYDYIKKLVKKNDEDEVEFFLIPTENTFNNTTVYQLVLEQPSEEISNVNLDEVPVQEYNPNEVQDTSFLSPEPETNEVNTEEESDEVDPLMDYLSVD